MRPEPFDHKKKGKSVAVTDDPAVDTSVVINTIAQNQERLRQGHNAVVGVLGVMDDNITQLREDVDELQGDRPNWQRCWVVAIITWGVLMVLCSWLVFKLHWDGFIDKPADVDKNYVYSHKLGVALKDIFAFSSLVSLLVLLLMSFHESRVSQSVSSGYHNVRGRLGRSGNQPDNDTEDDDAIAIDLTSDDENAVETQSSARASVSDTLAALEADPALLDLLHTDDPDTN